MNQNLSLYNIFYVVAKNQNISHASKELYISWDTAVSMAYERYETVIDNYKCGLYPKHSRISDALMTGNGELMNVLSHLPLSDD